MYCICGEIAAFSCSCKLLMYYCQNCASEHIKDMSVFHNLSTISIKVEKNIKSIVILSIQKNIKKIQENKNKVISDLSRLIQILNKRSKSIYQELDKIEKKLEELIYLILEYPEKISEKHLKNTLFMSQEAAQVECNSWDLACVNFSTEIIENSISSWISIENNLKKHLEDDCLHNSAIFNNRRESLSLSQNLQLENIIPQDQIIEKFSSYDSVIVNSSKNNPDLLYQSLYMPYSIDDNRMNNESRPQSLRYDNTMNIAKPNSNSYLMCSQGHELKWSISSLFQSFQKDKSLWIICNLCNQSFSKAGWNCSLCKYNICDECGLQQNFKPIKLYCPREHPLLWKCDTVCYYLSISQKWPFYCKSCNQTIECASWHCRECQYDIWRII